MRCIADSLLLMYAKRDCHFTISAKQQSLFIDTFYFLSFTSSNAFRKIRSNSFSEHFSGWIHPNTLYSAVFPARERAKQPEP